MAVNVSIGLKTSLQQTLTPQQIQYLKLLQMPIIQFEQEIKKELDENPLLELSDENTDILPEDLELVPESPIEELPSINTIEGNQSTNFNSEDIGANFDYDELGGKDLYFDDVKIISETPLSNYVPGEDEDPYHLYTLMLQDDAELSTQPNYSWDEDEEPIGFQIKDTPNFIEQLEEQLALYPLTFEERLIGKHILWNVDDDGYLRRELTDIVKETNSHIAEINFERQKNKFLEQNSTTEKLTKQNPAYNYKLDETSKSLLGAILIKNPDIIDDDHSEFVRYSFNQISEFLKPVNLEQAEKVLKLIQKLDPPGIASRNIQECLIAQLKAKSNFTGNEKLALELLENAFEEFSKKHFKEVQKKLNISEDELKQAIEVIKKLNPKPGEGISVVETNTVIPDFIVEIDDKTGEPIVTLNDSTIPPIKISSLYEQLKRDSKEKKFNKETKQWIRAKYEEAKFLIQAIQQRKITMLKVMVAIAGIQKEFFINGPNSLKPMIYKDISDVTGLDISTVCRIVNNKFVQTPFGTFELKYFFSEALPTDEGEEVSTTIIKQKIKEMIDNEDKNKPLSDDMISKNLKEAGFNVARRTIAKYREQLKIPVARLRRELK